MSYSTGTSTGPHDLLDKLRLFLIADGWSVNMWADDDSTYESGWSGINGDGKRLHVQKVPDSGGPTMYFNFKASIRGIIFDDYYPTGVQVGGKYYSEITGIGLYGSTGYDGGENFDNQPGHPTNGSSQCWGAAITELSTTAIPAYYFFSDSNTVVVCIEYASGKYQWFAFGLLEKEGQYSGGQFFFGSLSSAQASYDLLYNTPNGPGIGFMSHYYTSAVWRGHGGVYVVMDSQAGWRASGHEGSETTGLQETLLLPGFPPSEAVDSYAYKNTFNSVFFDRSPNFYNSLAPFVPIYIFGKRSDNNYSLLGIPQSIRMVNPQYYDPAEEVVLGSDTWMIFPQHDKDNDIDARQGFAVKKVT
jgi:hypothetical protein